MSAAGSPIISQNVRLSSYSSWLVGGDAEYFSEPRDLSELQTVLKWARSKNQEITILSGGTNVLISDHGVSGLVIALKKMSFLEARELDGRLVIECLAGTSKSELLKVFLKHRLEPALFLAGLPGDVGGGVAMNAGIGELTTPREFVEIVDWIEVMRWSDSARDFEVRRFMKSDLDWSYRHCEGWRPGVMTRVGLSWPLEPQADILARVKQANQIRLTKQPLDMPSCGSVFVNPPGGKSGQLIESCGLKGFSIGGAQVSKKHANFIVNTGGAKAADIHGVIEHVRTTVREHTGFELKTEVVRLGRW